MRSQEEILKIKSRFSKPYSIYNFLNAQDLDSLIEIFDNASQKLHKNTGPITLDLLQFKEHPVVQKIFSKIKDAIGEYEINAAFFFRTDFPHIIHNDDTYELKDVYKAITIPLKLYGNYTDLPRLCFFDQYYFHGPAKFFKGSEDMNIPAHYNKHVYDYSQVDNLSKDYFTMKLYTQLFTHLNPKWLDGLSLDSAVDWMPSNAIVFDSVQLHCASDFRRVGVKSKLGISVFTRKP